MLENGIYTIQKSVPILFQHLVLKVWKFKENSRVEGAKEQNFLAFFLL